MTALEALQNSAASSSGLTYLGRSGCQSVHGLNVAFLDGTYSSLEYREGVPGSAACRHFTQVSQRMSPNTFIIVTRDAVDCSLCMALMCYFCMACIAAWNKGTSSCLSCVRTLRASLTSTLPSLSDLLSSQFQSRCCCLHSQKTPEP